MSKQVRRTKPRKVKRLGKRPDLRWKKKPKSIGDIPDGMSVWLDAQGRLTMLIDGKQYPVTHVVKMPRWLKELCRDQRNVGKAAALEAVKGVLEI